MSEFRHIEQCMGTVFQYLGYSDSSPTEAIAESVAVLHEADQTFSLYIPDSPLSRLARGETSISELPEIVSFIWDECEKWSELTDGWFSAMTKENTFDPSGYVKAWATIEAAKKLTEHGISDFAINAGGDILLSDRASNSFPKRIGVAKAKSIAETTDALTVLDLANTDFYAVATSGTSERGEHIWNPKSYAQANELKQVTVIAKDLITADVLATAIFASGSQAEKLITKFTGEIEVLVIDRETEVFATPGFSSLVAPV